MNPEIKQVLPVYPSHMYIQWTVEDRNSALGSITLLRSQSEQGPFTVIAELDSNQYSFSDTECNLMGLTRAYWYMIKANPAVNTSQFVLSSPKTVEYGLVGERAKLARKARYNLKLQLERLNGVPIIVLKRKSFGERCPECFNQITNDVLYSHCNTCYGTTYTGGYHDPIEIFGKIDPVAVQQSIGSSGPNDYAVTGLTIVDYPVVDINDIIIEKRTNRRFKVMRRVTTESSRVLVHQDLQISELSRAGIEYEIPVGLS